MLDPDTDVRATFDRFSTSNLQANIPVVDLVRQIATQRQVSPTQVSLTWLLATKPFIVPIPGTRNLEHLRENLGAASVQLTAEDVRQIGDAFGAIQVSGARMNKSEMQAVDQTT